MKKTDKDQIFDTELGQKATVEHHQIANDQYTAELREVLVDMAKDLQRTGKAPKEYEYKGSFSVHVYASSMDGNFAFAGVTNPGTCHYKLAEAAMMKLREDVEEHYSGRRRVKRSGF